MRYVKNRHISEEEEEKVSKMRERWKAGKTSCNLRAGENFQPVPKVPQDDYRAEHDVFTEHESFS